MLDFIKAEFPWVAFSTGIAIILKYKDLKEKSIQLGERNKLK